MVAHEGGPETYKADIRALSGISTGVICYQVAIKLKKVQLNSLGKAFMSAIKWSCYSASIIYMHIVYATKQDYFYIFLIAIAIIISYSQQGLDSRIFLKKGVIWLGKFSLYLYLTHVYWAENLNILFTQNLDNTHKMLVYLVLTFINAFILWEITNLYKKYKKNLRKIAAKLFESNI